MSVKKLIKSINIYKGRILNLKVDVVEMTNGNVTTREIVDHKEAAAIIAINEDNEIILVEQDRYGVGKIIELPAGLIEDGESPSDIAYRELKEETGYNAGKLLKLNSFYPSAGFTNELIHLFIATDLKKGEQHLDLNEDIAIVKLPLENLHKFILDNTVKIDSKILAAIAYLDIYKEGIINGQACFKSMDRK
ncbi:NUDIX hydrolase [Clostridium tertium]|uniref:NUDIX hydrolase n=1 Tax=Clostridium tertium TaxID=1559 RepID=UPI0023B21E27|nr:NUDIX hydrolase [Clostridium tertium]